MNPLISIIMPVYNAEMYLSKTLNSLQNQIFQNWELIALDDCSIDGSLAILREYSKNDKRINVVQKEKNSGSADTRNLGIQSSIGKFISFLDADDLWDKEFLVEMIDFMNKNQSPFSFSSYRIIDEEEKELTKPFLVPYKKFTLQDMLYYNRVGLLTAIYDSEKLGKMYFDTSLKSLRDDYALWIDIIKKTGYGYGNPSILASYRVRQNAMTSNKKKVVKAHFKMLKNHAGLSLPLALFFTLTHSAMGFKKYIINKV